MEKLHRRVEKFFSYIFNVQSNICFDTLSSQIALFWNYLIYNFVENSCFKSLSEKLFVYCLFEVK